MDLISRSANGLVFALRLGKTAGGQKRGQTKGSPIAPRPHGPGRRLAVRRALRSVAAPVGMDGTSRARPCPKRLYEGVISGPPKKWDPAQPSRSRKPSCCVLAFAAPGVKRDLAPCDTKTPTSSKRGTGQRCDHILVAPPSLMQLRSPGVPVPAFG